jgi:hypothetical protein
MRLPSARYNRNWGLWGSMKPLRQTFLALALLVLPTVVLRTVLGAGSQVAKPMPDLTVPATRLPPGCLLAPRSDFESVVVARSGGVTVTRVDPGVTTNLPPAHQVNPWVGSDVQTVGWLRSRMSFEGPTPAFAFDPPVTDPRQVHNIQQAPDAAIPVRRPDRPDWTEQAAGLAEGYSAVYLESGGRELTVRAVRISPDANPRPSFPTAPNAVKIGSDVVAVIEPDAGPCAAAIQTYLKHLHR